MMKTTKKLLAVLLSVLMLFSTVAFAASAAPADYAETEEYGALHFRYYTDMVAGISNVRIEPDTTEENCSYVYFTVTLNEGYSTARFFLNVDAPISPELISKDGYVANYRYKFFPDNDRMITVRAIPKIKHSIDFRIADEDEHVLEVPKEKFTYYRGDETHFEFTVTLENGFGPVFEMDGDIDIFPEFKSQNGNVFTYVIDNPEGSGTYVVHSAPMRYTVEIIDSKYGDQDPERYPFYGEVGYGESITIPTIDLKGYVTDNGEEMRFSCWSVIEWGYVNDEYWENIYETDDIAKVVEEITTNLIIESRYEKVIPHDHDSDPSDPDSGWELAEIRKATCTEDGAYVYICGRCQEGVIKEVPIKARGHKLSPWITTKAPTCTEKGEKTRACLNIEETDLYKACIHIEKAEINPLGHSFGEWVIVTPPTCTEKGKAERTCTNDSSHKEYKDIDAKGHRDSDGDRLCDDCGESFGHCSDCICHKGNVLSYVMRYLCTFLSRMFHTNIKCCDCMEWYKDELSSIS